MQVINQPIMGSGVPIYQKKRSPDRLNIPHKHAQVPTITPMKNIENPYNLSAPISV